MANQETEVRRFQGDLERLAKKLDIAAGVAIRKTVFDIHRSVTEISPVDTGRFRASWGISVWDIPDDPGADPHPNPNRDEGGRTTNPLPLSMQNERVPANLDFADPYAVYWIYNNLPYAQRLEDGWSGQAPNGILDIALATVEADIAAALDQEWN